MESDSSNIYGGTFSTTCNDRSDGELQVHVVCGAQEKSRTKAVGGTLHLRPACRRSMARSSEACAITQGGGEGDVISPPSKTHEVESRRVRPRKFPAAAATLGRGSGTYAAGMMAANHHHLPFFSTTPPPSELVCPRNAHQPLFPFSFAHTQPPYLTRAPATEHCGYPLQPSTCANPVTPLEGEKATQ
jgi:hypothetical protein